ncbi:zinc finger CCHC domain-containing protein 14-like isoform X2 [Lytechinus variegatus]|uniref:zinc finger CCHC domain-containing protein 14-like isoform X2 n=1 Tax=Lytechinus variegatus TaxID=7654 RepID=UPI001BB2C07F|nr:zinc finger CCHC domain-containing protein 14-like isoform X2 [Lytechinus variegatus]
MVCKKEVIAWFCDLTASRRIDFLCALMDCCSPLELRFLGTYVESLGRRDYDRLRESELHANDVSYLSKLTNITDIRILDKVLTSLALMNSRCTDGASVLYRTLKEHTDAILSNGFRTRHHTETDEKVVLLAVIAVNHPAFTFSQKQALRSQLYALLQAVESKIVPEMDEVEDNPNTTDNVTSKETKEQLVSASTSNPDNREIDKVNHSQDSPPVHIKAIEVKGLINRQSDKRLEYTFQVHWSDSTVSCVSKTHAQLFDFQCKLVQLFPDEASTEQQDRVIPYIPGKRIFSMTPPGEQGEKTQTEIVEYTKQLSALPQHILQCDHVIQFFCSNVCDGSGMQQDIGHHSSISPSAPPAEKPKPPLPAVHLPALVTNQAEINKQLEQFAAGVNKTQVFPAALAQMQQSIQPHSMQQALQHQQQPSIHLRHPQPQQFPNVHIQQQQQQHQQSQQIKGHVSPHPHLPPHHPHMQMQSHAHIQLQQQQQVQQHTQHHHHHQQLLSPGNPQLQQQLPPPPQQQLHQPPPPPGTPTHNIAASVNQLHISQHHHQVNLPAPVQPHNNGNGSEGSTNNTNGGGGGGSNGGNVSMHSNNNSMVTATVTTTSAGNNSVYYQTVSSMVFIPTPSEQYTNAGSTSESVSVSQQSYKSVQPNPPQNWPPSFTTPGNPPTHTASLYASAPSTTHVCISQTPLQSPIFRCPVPYNSPQTGLAPSSSREVAPIIHEWLKKQRLHKYAYLFEGMSFDQVLKLSDEQIDRWNIVKGAKGRIKTQLEQLRKNDLHLFNGLTPQALGMHPNMGITPGFFMTPPPPGSAGTLLPHMAAAHIVSLQQQQQQQLGEGTGSECSSPPSSPRDSSDENDRDSEESESSATSCAETIQSQAKRRETSAGMPSPQQTSPRELVTKNRNQPSATSLPYSQVVKSVGVDAGRQGDRSPIPPGEPRQVAIKPQAGTAVSPMQQQQQQQQSANNDQQPQQLQLQPPPQKPHMHQQPPHQMQQRMNAMPSQPLPAGNTVVIGKQLPQVVSPDGNPGQLHQLDSPVIAGAPFTPHVFHIKQGNKSVHTVQYIQGDGEGGGFRTSKVVVQQAVPGARGSIASPSPPIPAGTLQSRSDVPMSVMQQHAQPQEQVNPTSKTVHNSGTIQLLPNLHSLALPTTDGYIAPTSVTYVTSSKQSLAISSDSTPCNNNLSSYNSCTSCGCNGQCGQANHQPSTSAPSSNSNGNSSSSSSSNLSSSHMIHFNQPTTYIAGPGQLNFPNYYHQGNMIPPGTPNSMRNAPPPSMPHSNGPRYPPPMPPSPLQGGLPDMMYGGNPHFGMMPPGAQMYLSGLGGMGHRGHGIHGGGGAGGSKKGQMTCFNCGGQGHRASECREATMESITHNSHYRLNYKSSTSDLAESTPDS